MLDRTLRHRFFEVLRLMYEETDENNSLSLDEVITRLSKQHGPTYRLERRAVQRDIDQLIESGLPLESTTGRYNQKHYRWIHKPFERHEIRMLLDAVHSARFISKEDAINIVEKLKKLCSKFDAKDLTQSTFWNDQFHIASQAISQTLRTVDSALSQSHLIQFRYGKWNASRQFVMQQEGIYYRVNPISLAWVNDFYYLIGKCEDTGKIAHFRLDRMLDVSQLERTKRIADFPVADYLTKTFQMHGGTMDVVHMRINESLINVVYDRFGMNVRFVQVPAEQLKMIEERNVRITNHLNSEVAVISELDLDLLNVEHTTYQVMQGDEPGELVLISGDDERNVNYYEIQFEAAMSDGLTRWILSLGPGVEVLAPASLREQVSIMASKIAKLHD